MRESDNRASLRTELEVNVDLQSDHNFYTGLTQNMSAGGLFVATHHLRPVGDRLTLKFTLPKSTRALFAEAEVRWVRENTSPQRHDAPTGMGLRFVKLSPEVSTAIEQFLPDRDSIYYDDE